MIETLQQQLAEKGVEIEKLKGKKNVRLADDSSDREPKQQRHLAGSLEMGQLLERGQDTTAGNSKSEGVITLKGVDEYGPLLEWKTHWVDFPVGAEFFSGQQLAEKEDQRQGWMEQCRRQGQNAQVEIDRLKKQLAEKDAEIERLEEEGNMPVKYYQPNGKGQVYAVYGASSINFADSLLEQLAASQAREQQYREALKTAGMNCVDDFIAAGALQLADSKSDTTALEALIAKAGEVMRERCSDSAQTEMDEQYIDSSPWYAARACREAIRDIPCVTLEDLGNKLRRIRRLSRVRACRGE